MENSKGHGKSWIIMIMSWNFYSCTEKFCCCKLKNSEWSRVGQTVVKYL